MTTERQPLVSFEASIQDGAVLMRLEGARLVLDDSTLANRRPFKGMADVAIGRALYVDKPVIPQGYRKGLIEPSYSQPGDNR